MTSIFEVHVLERGYAPAREALRRIVESAIASGNAWIVSLRADLGLMTVGKNVLITFGHAGEGTHFEQVWAIRWEPENGGPFPEFRGILSVQYFDGGRAQLEIRGEYAPPFKAAGRGFDLAIGQRIAAQTCRTLLATIGNLIAERCA